MSFFDELNEIEKDHDIIRAIFLEIEDLAKQDEKIDIMKLEIKLARLSEIWDKHETAEEEFFYKLSQKKQDIPIEKFLVEHKQLKGHFKAIKEVISSKENNRIKVALETDGKMLMEKIKKHMELEEIFFYQIASK